MEDKTLTMKGNKTDKLYIVKIFHKGKSYGLKENIQRGFM